VVVPLFPARLFRLQTAPTGGASHSCTVPHSARAHLDMSPLPYSARAQLHARPPPLFPQATRAPPPPHAFVTCVTPSSNARALRLDYLLLPPPHPETLSFSHHLTAVVRARVGGTAAWYYRRSTNRNRSYEFGTILRIIALIIGRQFRLMFCPFKSLFVLIFSCCPQVQEAR
jgi:hypothetical protein